MNRPSTSVVICTYNASRELGLALCALARQVVHPDEILIADDGSGEETRRVIETWRNRLACPLIHCWQSDKGYRKARIVNEAVRQSSGELLIFLDGDSFPHPQWVADYIQANAKDRVQCGRRVKLGPELSSQLSCEQIQSGEFEGLSKMLVKSAWRGDTQRLGLGVRLPQGLARLFHPRPRHLMGVNHGMPREVFYRVNGLNEAWVFYGREDYDLELRLKRAGFSFYPLLNRGIVYHVHHTERERSAEALALVEAQENSGRARCEVGVETGLEFDPQQ